MARELNGKRVAILAADGVERVVQREQLGARASRSPDDLPAFCEAIVKTFARVGAAAGDAR